MQICNFLYIFGSFDETCSGFRETKRNINIDIEDEKITFLRQLWWVPNFNF